MPRVLVTTTQRDRPPSASVLLDEGVLPLHLEDEHAAAQLIERIAWAVSDAADEESARPHHARARRLPRRDATTRR
jgi:hypothetical protein